MSCTRISQECSLPGLLARVPGPQRAKTEDSATCSLVSRIFLCVRASRQAIGHVPAFVNEEEEMMTLEKEIVTFLPRDL